MAVIGQYTADGYIRRASDGAFCPPGSPGFLELQERIAAGDTVTAYVAPAQTADQVRATALKADAERQNFVDQIKAASPAQIDTYINNNVTDLASARVMLRRMAKALALLLRE